MRPIRICAYGNPSGSKFWRLIDPLKYLRKKGFDAYVSDNGINELEADWADIIIVQSCTDKKGIALLYQFQQEKEKKIVVEVDDFLELNEDSPFKHAHNVFEAQFVISRTMQVADAVTTTTDFLALQLARYNKNVKVLPNYIDEDRWNLPNLPNTTDRIRIGWAGSITHVEDVRMIERPIRLICKEFPQVQLIIVGDPRVAEIFKGLPVDNQLGVPFEAWPSKLRSLRLDIGLAPLRKTLFNQCKSNIKWIEYSIAGIPGVYSPTIYNDIGTKHFDGIYGMIAENQEQWYRCIKNYIISPELREDIAGRALSCVTTGYTLKTGIKKWVKFYRQLISKENSDIKSELPAQAANT